MVVTGTNNLGLFCPDMGDVTISGVTDDLVIQFTLSVNAVAKSIWTERYTPDASGVVVVRDLGKIMMDYFDRYGIDVNFNAIDPSASIYSGGIDARVDDVVLFSQPFYYATQKVGITSADYNRFFNRHAHRMVRADQYVPVVYNLNSQTLKVGVAYYSGDAVCYDELYCYAEEDDQNVLYQLRNLSPAVIASRINNQEDEDITADDIIYYEALLYVNNELVDKIHYDLDHRHYKQLTHLVFYNLFGFPETIYMTGKDEKSAEFEGTYALMGDQYTKIDTELNELHTLNSGYISDIGYESIKDLIRSKEVFLYQGTNMQRIAITDIDLTDAKPRSTPTNIKLTYRLAEDEATVFTRPALDNTRVFDDSFDYTFS